MVYFQLTAISTWKIAILMIYSLFEQTQTIKHGLKLACLDKQHLKLTTVYLDNDKLLLTENNSECFWSADSCGGTGEEKGNIIMLDYYLVSDHIQT